MAVASLATPTVLELVEAQQLTWAVDVRPPVLVAVTRSAVVSKATTTVESVAEMARRAKLPQRTIQSPALMWRECTESPLTTRKAQLAIRLSQSAVFGSLTHTSTVALLATLTVPELVEALRLTEAVVAIYPVPAAATVSAAAPKPMAVTVCVAAAKPRITAGSAEATAHRV